MCGTTAQPSRRHECASSRSSEWQHLVLPWYVGGMAHRSKAASSVLFGTKIHISTFSNSWNIKEFRTVTLAKANDSFQQLLDTLFHAGIHHSPSYFAFLSFYIFFFSLQASYKVLLNITSLLKTNKQWKNTLNWLQWVSQLITSESHFQSVECIRNISMHVFFLFLCLQEALR